MALPKYLCNQLIFNNLQSIIKHLPMKNLRQSEPRHHCRICSARGERIIKFRKRCGRGCPTQAAGRCIRHHAPHRVVRARTTIAGARTSRHDRLQQRALPQPCGCAESPRDCAIACDARRRKKMLTGATGVRANDHAMRQRHRRQSMVRRSPFHC